MKAKPWQIVVIALAFIGVGAALTSIVSPSGPDVPTRIMLVDVTTGQLYEVNLKRHRTGLPARDPEHKQHRLFPVKKAGSGWVLTENAMGMIRGTALEVKAVDLRTGEVTHASADVKQYVPPGT